MTSKSGKAKGRVLQDLVRNNLREIGKLYDLQDEDIKSQPMGQKGVDVILSPTARKIIDLDIECKNQENLVVPTIFWKHFNKYSETKATKLLFHKRNKQKALVTMRAEDFFALYERYIFLIKQCITSEDTT